MKIKLIKILAIALFVFPFLVSATSPTLPPYMLVQSAFRYYESVSPVLSKPTVVEVPFDQKSFSIPVFAVFNVDTKEFEPSQISIRKSDTKVYITGGGEVSIPSTINDNNYSTYFEFPVYGNQTFSTTLNFNFEKPVDASSLNFTLDNNVALPQAISIYAEVEGGERAVLTSVRPTSGNISFPRTTSNRWQVNFDYVQPLRISEIKINDLSITDQVRGLRFLAQPGAKYEIYFDADRYIEVATKEAGNLFSNDDVIRVKASTPVVNPSFLPLDSDGDGFPDLSDNCVSVYQREQKDSDKDGQGDECEDYDRDGVMNSNDNCMNTPNYAQTDTDADEVGDTCDDKDNRTTEQMPWLPWAGIVLAGAVILFLFVKVLTHKNENSLPPATPLS
jgi:Thrombospondin type 3 repeat